MTAGSLPSNDPAPVILDVDLTQPLVRLIAWNALCAVHFRNWAADLACENSRGNASTAAMRKLIYSLGDALHNQDHIAEAIRSGDKKRIDYCCEFQQKTWRDLLVPDSAPGYALRSSYPAELTSLLKQGEAILDDIRARVAAEAG